MKAVLFSAILFSAGLHAFEELEQIDYLAPMQGPDVRAVGWEWHFIDENQNPGYIKKIGDDKETASYRRTDGCQWTGKKSGFAPALTWDNCPSSGHSEYELVSGTIWPLETGRQFVYKGRAKTSESSKTYNFTRKCTVKGQFKVSAAAGIFDTYKVYCRDRLTKRTWWLSPEAGTIRYTQKSRFAENIIREMTKIVK